MIGQKIVGTALVAACLAAAACGTGPGPVGQGNYGTIFGTVTNASNGKPIQGAIVTVSVVVSVPTDANGQYRITNVPVDSPGVDETVAVTQATGFQLPAPKSVHVLAGQQYEADFQLQPSP
ncbi:MAG TPA: carboxypeptidase-like regulatory domain-containing protein [Candidatus Eremiobacteraceae bacterium]|nr:carboxypeptidase-like regulatory domain-containing protein [Candidatus Eremiobacteraceae bacterium]